MTPIPPTHDNIRAALSFVSPDIERDEWARTLAAVKSALGDDGKTIAREWSSNGGTFTEEGFRDTWKSIKAQGGVTVATLWHKAKEEGWRPDRDAHQETEAERLERERRQTARAEKEANDKARRERQAAVKTAALWKAASDLQADHPYFSRKLPGATPPATLREIQATQAAEILGYAPQSDGEPLQGRLIVAPVKIGDKVTTAELIDENGRKSAIYGGPKGGGYWAAQPMPEGDGAGMTIQVAEGIATALSAKDATGSTTVAALSAGNLPAIAKAMRKLYPAAKLGILADLGNGQAKAEQAARETGAALAIPQFTREQVEAFQGERGKPPTDFNDLAHLAGADAVRGQIEAALAGRAPGTPPPLAGFSLDELEAARPHPDCIVENYLYADLDLVAAAGGTGKTTTLIFEAVNMVLGRPLWGLRVWNPGATLFVTAEDPRELFAARLREILNAMDLQPGEQEKALAGVHVWDVSGDLVRMAKLDQGGNIILTNLADSIVAAYKDNPPAVVVFDPCVSFGPGERMVNDGEQAIVTACRRIIRGLGCAVRIVHHTGKANARNGAIDQYASRGGTALPDGSRMVHILSSVNDGEHGTPPAGFYLAEGDSGFVLARAKLSYAPPQPKLWIRRSGYKFEHFVELRESPEAVGKARAEQLERFLVSELNQGRHYTRNTLDTKYESLGMSRQQGRAALAELEVGHRVHDAELPKEQRVGRKKTFLQPSHSAVDPGGIEGGTHQGADLIPPPSIIPPPYREEKNGGINAVPFSPLSPIPPNETAECGGIGGIEENSHPLEPALDVDDTEEF